MFKLRVVLGLWAAVVLIPLCFYLLGTYTSVLDGEQNSVGGAVVTILFTILAFLAALVATIAMGFSKEFRNGGVPPIGPATREMAADLGRGGSSVKANGFGKRGRPTV